MDGIGLALTQLVPVRYALEKMSCQLAYRPHALREGRDFCPAVTPSRL